MRVAIIGAGAVGSYHGALLALAGHPVTMIGRPAHVAAMRAKGLRLHKDGGTRTARVEATVEPAGARGAELVLVCVKSDDTEAAGAALAPHVAPAATVLSLQNGVDNAERLAAVLGRAVVPAAVYVAVATPGPGEVTHHGRGELVIGDGPDSRQIAALFAGAGIPTEVSGDLRAVLWTKLTVNCAYNALCAITQTPYGRMIAVEGARAAMADIVAECRAVAAALGVTLPETILDIVYGVATSMSDQFSSTAQDLARGRRSEIEHLNGAVVREAERLGLAAPANRLLLVAVRMKEAGYGGA